MNQLKTSENFVTLFIHTFCHIILSHYISSQINNNNNNNFLWPYN